MDKTAGPATSAAPSKFLELARKIKEIEQENAKLAYKLDKSNQHLFRLRLERSILFEKLKQIKPELVVDETKIRAQLDSELQALED